MASSEEDALQQTRVSDLAEDALTGAAALASHNLGSSRGGEPSADAAAEGPSEPEPHGSGDDFWWLLGPSRSPVPSLPEPSPQLDYPESDLSSFHCEPSGARSLEPEDIWYDSVREDPLLPSPSAEECNPAWADAGSLDEQPLALSESSVPKRPFEDARWAEVVRKQSSSECARVFLCCHGSKADGGASSTRRQALLRMS